MVDSCYAFMLALFVDKAQIQTQTISRNENVIATFRLIREGTGERVDESVLGFGRQ